MWVKIFIPAPIFLIIKKIYGNEEFPRTKIRPSRFPYWEVEEEYMDEVLSLLKEMFGNIVRIEE